MQNLLEHIRAIIHSQTFESGDIAIVLLLIVLEGVLSVDNALVLGLLARRLPVNQRGKALTYGLVGALIFRLVAVFLAAWLLKTRWVKLLGGAYLVYLALKHIIFSRTHQQRRTTRTQTGGLLLNPRAPQEPDENASDAIPADARFWPTVVAIEFTDIAFAVDSILAAIALVSEHGAGRSPTAHPKLWVVVTGGMLGVVLVRMAAVIFIRLIERFPRFELAAYLLVLVIGLKLIVEWQFNLPGEPPRVVFHSPHHLAFWVFWTLMVASFCVGFIPGRRQFHPN